MNSTYRKVLVNVLHNGQYRKAYLHVVKPIGKKPVYFLFDYFGRAIDDIGTVKYAATQFTSGNYTEATI